MYLQNVKLKATWPAETGAQENLKILCECYHSISLKQQLEIVCKDFETLKELLEPFN